MAATPKLPRGLLSFCRPVRNPRSQPDIVMTDPELMNAGFQHAFGNSSNEKQRTGMENSFLYPPSESGDSTQTIKHGEVSDSVSQPEMDSVSLSQAYESMKPVMACPHNREDITQTAQQLIDDLNAKRKQDTQIMEDFKKVLDLQVQKTCSVVENQMSVLYEKQGKIIEDKIQELFACLDRIAKIEVELQEFKQALQILYQDMNST